MLFDPAGRMQRLRLSTVEERRRGVTESINVDDLTGYLADKFPRFAADIHEVSGDNYPAWLSAAELVRDVFVSRIFRRAVLEHAVGVLDQCYSTVEDMLSSGDDQVRRCVVEYVVPAVLSSAQWAGETRARAGPLLTSAVDIDRGGRMWRTADVDYHEERRSRTASLAVHRYHRMLYAHAYRPHVDGGSGIVRPFLALAADIESEKFGAQLVVLIRDVLRSQNQESAHEVTELLKFVGGADWRDFYTNARTVNITVADDGFRAVVSPRHKRQDGEWFGSKPGEPLEVNDWREPDAIGRAALTALAIASTTGWRDP